MGFPKTISEPTPNVITLDMLMERKLSPDMTRYYFTLGSTIRTREVDYWYIPKDVVEAQGLMYCLARMNICIDGSPINNFKGIMCWCENCDQYHQIESEDTYSLRCEAEGKENPEEYDMFFCDQVHNIDRATQGIVQDCDNSVPDYDMDNEDDNERLRLLLRIVDDIQDELRDRPDMEVPEQGEFIYSFVRENIHHISGDIVQFLVHSEEGLEWCNGICYSHGVSAQQEREEYTAMTERARVEHEARQLEIDRINEQLPVNMVITSNVSYTDRLRQMLQDMPESVRNRLLE